MAADELLCVCRQCSREIIVCCHVADLDPDDYLCLGCMVDNANRHFHQPRVFSEDDWSRLQALAARKDRLSKRKSWTREWSPHYNLLGVVGEALYGKLIGKKPNTGFADGGTDFPGVDVKASKHWDDPALMRVVTDPLKAPFFALVAVDLDKRRARYVGWATRKELEQASTVEYGYGETRRIPGHLLHSGLPA